MMRLPMYQAAPNSLKHSLEASQFPVTRQMTTRQAPADMRSGLDKGSLKALDDFAANQGVALNEAWSRAEEWLDKKARRETQVRMALKALPCANSTLALMGQAPAGNGNVAKTPPADSTANKAGGGNGVTTSNLAK